MQVEDILKHEFSSIEEAIENSNYKKRISFLLQNPSLGCKSICKLGGYYEQSSNCFGTTVFLVDGEKAFLRREDCKIKDNAIFVRKPKATDFCVFPYEERPGYIDPKFMEWFLKDRCVKLSELEKDCIIATTGILIDNEERSKGYGLLHTCVYLGSILGKPWVFHQKSEGKHYEAVPLREFWNVEKTEYYQYPRVQ